VIQGPGENAGVVDIGDGDCVVFKMESHNHPSYIEPYQGAATGVGGILRDVFTMGARPDRCHERAALRRTGSSEDPPPRCRRRCRRRRLRQFLRRADGRRRSQFDPRYNGNCLVNAFAAGLAKTDAFSSRKPRASAFPWSISAPRPAATVSVAQPWRRPNSTRSIEEKRPTVQVGDPFTEKCLLEACLELMADRRRHRHPGHGCSRPHLLRRRDGRQGRSRHRARSRQGAGARRAHERL
jgi:phosphoribosylformylglycinamidine (FGAM) synthase-like enzyme